MSVLLGETRPVARKAHFCCACLGTIQPGERYVRQRVAAGAEAWVWKAHPLCDMAAWRVARDADLYDEEGPDPDEVREMVGRLLTVPLLAPAAP